MSIKYNMNIIVFDINKNFIKEATRLEKYGIKVIQANVKDLILQHNVTAVVSPANSMGFMNGGIDKIYMEIFPGIEKMVQDTIVKIGLKTLDNRDYLPIGSAITVNTKNKNCPYLICAPTMFLPSMIKGTNNVFISFIAILYIAKNNPNCIIACPGLGTGVGHVTSESAINQIESAIKNYNSFTDNDHYNSMIKYSDTTNLVLHKIPCAQTNIYGNKFIPK
jgi:O-acetyl-ADP-ribose deacetylase (regulator of RNase III)